MLKSTVTLIIAICCLQFLTGCNDSKEKEFNIVMEENGNQNMNHPVSYYVLKDKKTGKRFFVYRNGGVLELGNSRAD